MKILSLFIALLSLPAFSQVNIQLTNSLAADVLEGNYNPLDFQASQVISQKEAVINGIHAGINPDSLKAYILKLATFYNRNTASDTLSLTTGIGAARRWVYSKFQEFSAQQENRLIPSYLQFDQLICTQTQHRNILAVLPGSDTANHRIIVLEGHIDSRCSDECDPNCMAQGIEDNASGTALVLELARVMSKYSFKNTLVFMLTIGEEQGLYGGNAFAQYALDQDLPVKAVFNNDVIGGIICGETSSPPSCPGINNIDSLQVRLFSHGGYNSKHKQLSRFTKLQYTEELIPVVSVPMLVSIMSAEDRSGRGGDHIPFREKGFAAIRFTSANEHGDASNGTDYSDRQHTSEDVLGLDTDQNGDIDSFFVDFNYLARNAVINGAASAMAALGPNQIDFTLEATGDGGMQIEITGPGTYPAYRVALRTTVNDWDSVYTFNTTSCTIYPVSPASVFFMSVAAVDASGIESLFSREFLISGTQLGVTELEEESREFELLQNRPNPFDEVTIISVKVNDTQKYKKAFILIRDTGGKLVQKLPIVLEPGLNEVNYEHGYGRTGVYSYTLEVDGREISTKRMIFAN